MNSEEEKILIKKYLAGNCSLQEIKSVKDILQRTDAQQIFNQIWDEEWVDKITPETNNAPLSQKLRWKQKLEQRIFDDAAKTPTEVIKPFYQRNTFWRYAAVLIIGVVGLSLWQLNNAQKNDELPQAIAFEEKLNPQGQRSKIVLPDSSTVYLGAMSKLRFVKNFSGKTREVELEGEAFFEVTKNPHKPFIIRTGNVSTQVLGTSFKIDAFAGKPISVLVSTGKVRVDRHVDNRIEPIAMLLPGETVTWDEHLNKKTLNSVAVADVLGWKEGRLFFNETKLEDIAEILKRWYNVDIKINSKTLANRLVKVNLTTNISIAKIMNILSVAGDFQYQINGKEIIIKNKERTTM
ncbi:FecR family protein [Pedobacter xixiisoli]|uniref:FecR family protein n=1 Tax=Pedobacter xixiisoli TaxID=1476464 RepID=A0A285ZUP5_9SPHI|nr:FecR domain-containing protein [Pedobacter xixiisoli]SOD13352.1 FecR family protein [Pedobacter xixiisoli]